MKPGERTMVPGTGLDINKILEARKRFDDADPEIQYYLTVARRVHMRHALLSRSDTNATLEDAARTHLTREVSGKYADLLLSKDEFRKVLGIEALPG